MISDAIRHGDTHEETMEMADYWLLEKQLIHKLFKVLVPRYESYNISYTRLLKLSTFYPNAHPMAVLELRGRYHIDYYYYFIGEYSLICQYAIL